MGLFKSVLMAVSVFAAGLMISSASSAAMSSAATEKAKIENSAAEIARENIRDTVWLNNDDIEECYDNRLKAAPGLKGSLQVNWEIDENGQASDFKRAKGSILDDALFNCVSGKMATWEFPGAPQGVKVSVSYPFLFSPEKKDKQ